MKKSTWCSNWALVCLKDQFKDLFERSASKVIFCNSAEDKQCRGPTSRSQGDNVGSTQHSRRLRLVLVLGIVQCASCVLSNSGSAGCDVVVQLPIHL